jgi:hypothetical protein
LGKQGSFLILAGYSSIWSTSRVIESEPAYRDSGFKIFKLQGYIGMIEFINKPEVDDKMHNAYVGVITNAPFVPL